jgi:hypothetical protein
MRIFGLKAVSVILLFLAAGCPGESTAEDDGCAVLTDCPAGQRCQDGACIEISEDNGGESTLDGGDSPDAGPSPDAGMVSDAGPIADAGFSSDAAVNADAGPSADGGGFADGGLGDGGLFAPDGSASSNDAGRQVGVDAGVATDSGAGPDAGSSLDSGPATDAATPSADAGFRPDAAMQVDAGVNPGVDSGLDSGADSGADSGVDSGLDAGLDAGLDSGIDVGLDGGPDAGQDSGSPCPPGDMPAADAGFCNLGSGEPRLCLTFDVDVDIDGGIGLVDQSSFNHGGTATGMTHGSGIEELGLAVLGAGEAIVPNDTHLQVTDSFTIEAWINPEALPSGAREGILDNSGQFGIFVYADGSMRCSATGLAGMGYFNSPANTVKPGMWQHLGCVYNGSAYIAYHQGVEVARITTSGSPNPGNDQLVIGANEAPTINEQFNGTLDRVRVSGVALTPGEMCWSAQRVP